MLVLFKKYYDKEQMKININTVKKGKHFQEKTLESELAHLQEKFTV